MIENSILDIGEKFCLPSKQSNGIISIKTQNQFLSRRHLIAKDGIYS